MTALALDREQLIRDHVDMILPMARWLLKPNGFFVLGDLISYGYFGLRRAARDYSPDHGASFRTYASTAIRGAILDGFRQLDPFARNDRKREHMVDRARHRFAARESRFPTQRELAKELGWSPRELTQVLMLLERAHPRWLDEPYSGHLSGAETDTTLAAFIPDPRANTEHDVLAGIEHGELRQLLTRLTERDRLVISLYFWEGMVLREIGEVLGVTESRVCQILTRALERLREMVPDDLRVAA